MVGRSAHAIAQLPGHGADVDGVRFTRLVIEADRNTVSLTLHPSLTVVAGELSDQSLRAHLSAGYTVKKVLLDFLWDNSSLNYSTLLEMANPNYQPEKRKIAAAPLQRVVRKMRICAAQYHMRPIHSWQEFQRTVEFTRLDIDGHTLRS